jgi:hypothetical protein
LLPLKSDEAFTYAERFKLNNKQKSIVQPTVGQKNHHDVTLDGEIFEKLQALMRHMVYNSSVSNEHLNKILLGIYHSAKDILFRSVSANEKR